MSDQNFPEGVLGLRLLAAAAVLTGNAAETPAHPDAALLELCEQVLDLHAKHEAIWREARMMHDPFVGNPKYEAEMAKREECVATWKPLLGRIGKIRSKTGVGVYAKAMVLRNSYGTAPRLVLSLAEDLVTCPGLRAAIWPAAAEGK
jgi:hypothetical protein